MDTAPILDEGRNDDNNSHEERNGQCTRSMLDEVNGGNNGSTSLSEVNDENNDGNGICVEEGEVAAI